MDINYNEIINIINKLLQQNAAPTYTYISRNILVISGKSRVFI